MERMLSISFCVEDPKQLAWGFLFRVLTDKCALTPGGRYFVLCLRFA